MIHIQRPWLPGSGKMLLFITEAWERSYTAPKSILGKQFQPTDDGDGTFMSVSQREGGRRSCSVCTRHCAKHLNISLHFPICGTGAIVGYMRNVPIGSGIWTLVPTRFMMLFGKAIEPLGGRALPEKGRPWGWALRACPHFLSLLPPHSTPSVSWMRWAPPASCYQTFLVQCRVSSAATDFIPLELQARTNPSLPKSLFVKAAEKNSQYSILCIRNAKETPGRSEPLAVMGLMYQYNCDFKPKYMQIQISSSIPCWTKERKREGPFPI